MSTTSKTPAAARGLMNEVTFMPQQARVIRTHRPWWSRAWRSAYAAYLRWCERSVIDERKSYEAAGFNMGPEYIRNSYRQEELLRVRIADLENS